MAKIAAFIDGVFAVIKWPVGVAMLLALPGALVATATVLFDSVQAFARLWPLFAGLAVYLVAWLALFRRRSWGAWLSTLEHEMTHALFAFVTGHRIVGIRTSWREGGEVRFVGKGNWLIVIAPYFFPTAALALALVLGALPATWLRWASALLGAAIAYHITSTWVETHGRQTDLHNVRVLFAVLFLPTANLLAYGWIFALVLGGWSASWAYLGDAARVSWALYDGLLP